MKFINFFKKLFGITFALYTCLAFTMIFLYKASGLQGGLMWAWTDIAKMFGDILVFAVWMAIIVSFTDIIPKIPGVLRHIIKLVLGYIAFYFWMLDGVNVKAGNILMMSTIYVVVFAVISAGGAILATIEKKLAVPSKEYNSIYTSGEGAKENNGKDGNKK